MLWRINREEGTAVGPTSIIETTNGRIEMSALWSDEEGVGVALYIPQGLFVTTAEVSTIRQGLDNLLAIPAPIITTK